MKNTENRNICLVIIALLCYSTVSYAQQGMQAQYFSNRYLANAAMAGIEKGAVVSANHMASWNRFPGAPLMYSVTAEYGGEKVGLGVNIGMDRAGLQRFTRSVATYAYHLKVNEVSRLDFGLSVGALSQRITENDVVGDLGDAQLGAYNQRKLYIDGDFGLGYTYRNFGAELALSNMRFLFNKDNERELGILTKIYLALDYKIAIGDAEVQPRAAYRQMNGTGNIWDAGAQLALLNRQLLFNGMYHSNGNAGFGFGMDLKNRYLITFTYGTQMGTLSSYLGDNFELNLRIRFKGGR